MWARIMGEQLVEMISRPKELTIDNVVYPKQIFTSWTVGQRTSLGIVPVEKSGSYIDNMFYTSTESAPAVQADKVVVSYSQVANKVSDVKVSMKTHINKVLQDTLSQTDWVVTRKTETARNAPVKIAKWRADLRDKAVALETAIDSKTTLEELEAMTVITAAQFDAGVTTAEFHNWPENPKEEVS